MDLSLRTATDADVPALIAFWQVAGENDGRPVDTPDAVRRLIARDPDALLIATYDGDIVGTAIAGWDGWRAHVYRLAVTPAVRRQGVARRLLAHAEERLGRLGATRFDAMVLDANDLGRSIWEAGGYCSQDDWSRWVKSNHT